MKGMLQNIKEEAKKRIDSLGTLEELEAIRVEFLGKKGKMTSVLRGMGKLSKEERPIIGQLANETREFVDRYLKDKKELLANAVEELKLKQETIDITLPGKRKRIGNIHPLTKTIEDIEELFIGMGYEIAEGPEVEYDKYNFGALNIPKDHPARDEQDTFYVNENIVLRTQTSPVQIRVMEVEEPPIKIICPGRVYRSDAVDATHSPIFYQMEGLVIDKGVTMGDLIGTLKECAKGVFGEDTKIRLRPHHFPFTEPSAEVDVSCWNCHGKGCRMCKNEGWIEILGAGMVHPKVLSFAGIDPNVYSGFAFGLGIDRITMGKFNIDDLRHLYENDVRFLKQF